MKVFAHYLSANDLALEIILISTDQNKMADRCPPKHLSRPAIYYPAMMS